MREITISDRTWGWSPRSIAALFNASIESGSSIIAQGYYTEEFSSSEN